MQLLHRSPFKVVKVFAFQPARSLFNNAEVLNMTHFNVNTTEKEKIEQTPQGLRRLIAGKERNGNR